MWRALKNTSALVCFLAGIPAAVAQPAAKAEAPSIPSLGFEGLLETAGGLVIILALILGLAWVVRRLGHVPGMSKGLVRVLGGASLGPRERVVVVEVDEIRLLLGVAPGRVQALHVLPGKAADNEFADRLDAEMEGRQV